MRVSDEKRGCDERGQEREMGAWEGFWWLSPVRRKAQSEQQKHKVSVTRAKGGRRR